VDVQVGFLVRIEGQRLTADVEECLPDYEFAFEGVDDGVPGMFYRCTRTRELQAEFGDMLHRIHDLEAGSPLMLNLAVDDCSSCEASLRAYTIFWSISFMVCGMCYDKRTHGSYWPN